jgi:primosomal protein N' (replication factor Y)
MLLQVGPTRLVQVAIERGIDRYPDGLTYALPEGLEGLVAGDRVVVPLGRGNVPTSGWIVRTIDAAEAGAHLDGLDPSRLKEVLRVDPSGARLPGDLLTLAHWISEYYICPIGMTLAAMLPAAVRQQRGKVTRQFIDLGKQSPDPESLPPKFGRGRRRVLEVLHETPESERPLEIGVLAARAGLRTKGPIRALLEQGLVVGATRSSIHADWMQRSEAVAGNTAAPEPTRDQAAAIDAIAGALEDGFSQHLLFGVTGAGKTEVYIRLVDHVIRKGRIALVLVPEIALTPQTAGRLFNRFPDRRVALLHSGLTQAQRNQQWTMVADGEIDIVIGARSAIFAPIPDGRLGLIVVDEEHDGSYKQDSAPRYNGRDVAIRRAQLASCPILLGSATPSLETWHNAVNRDLLTLHRLPERAPGLALPRVEIVDFAEERRKWNDRRIHLLGPRLARTLTETISSGAQALILLNRRGYANYISCPDVRCGWVMQCEQCDAGMVYHRDQKPATRLHEFVRCHHCLTEQRLPAKCPQCSRKTTVFGLGTQRVEQEVRELLGPTIGEEGVKRVDSDTMRGASDFHETLDRFARGRIKVLLGTQMIAKGLDFPNVRLVGVVNADTALNLPDFRATERTYQLVSQVTGRCGRSTQSGIAIIQTFQPDAPAIRIAAHHDFETFANGELVERTRFGLPPVRRMARIVVRDQDESACRIATEQLAANLKPFLVENVELQAPEPCPIGRISGRCRWQLLLLAPDANTLRSVLRAARRADVIKPGERIAVDVDPLGLM